MWKPIEISELRERIAESEGQMEPAALRLWHLIRIPPSKWKQHPWGDLGDGFWVVGLFGQLALWFNDIEDGFNLSRYDSFGELSEYWCNQDKLFHVLNRIHHELETGEVLSHGNFGLPIPLDE